jgi:hypothetical protein
MNNASNTLIPASYDLLLEERPTMVPTAQEQMDLELESMFGEEE